MSKGCPTPFTKQQGPPRRALHELCNFLRDLSALRADDPHLDLGAAREVLPLLGPGVDLDQVAAGLELARGARAVIEVDGQRWWLHRRSVVNVGQVAFHPWAVGGRCGRARPHEHHASLRLAAVTGGAGFVAGPGYFGGGSNHNDVTL